MLFFFRLSRVRLRALTKRMSIGDVFSEGGVSAGGVTLGVGSFVGSIGVCANITFVSIQSIRGLC